MVLDYRLESENPSIPIIYLLDSYIDRGCGDKFKSVDTNKNISELKFG